MKATRPEVIRGIPVFWALEVLRSAWLRRDFRRYYSVSQVAEELDEFWSHSWKTPALLKYSCVLYLNNGLPALLIGMLCSGVAAVLYVAGVLPAWADFRYEFECFWCTPAGLIGFYAGLLLWGKRKL
ncbi:fam213a, partial [Symbiodinium pilosum]